MYKCTLFSSLKNSIKEKIQQFALFLIWWWWISVATLKVSINFKASFVFCFFSPPHLEFWDVFSLQTNMIENTTTL